MTSSNKKKASEMNPQFEEWKKGVNKLLSSEDQKLVWKYFQDTKRGQANQAQTPIFTEQDREVDKFVCLAKPQAQFTKYVEPSKYKIHNHLGNNFHIANKNAMFYNMRSYYEAIGDDVFKYLPLTFNVRNGENDPEYQRFLKHYEQIALDNMKEESKKKQNQDPSKKSKNIWIIKPGEGTNRGNGITVMQEIPEIRQLINQKDFHNNGKAKTYIIQKYLERPLLYFKRKFDIRCYTLYTYYNNHIKCKSSSWRSRS